MNEKRRGSQSRGVILQQDTARPHAGQHTRETINKWAGRYYLIPLIAPSSLHLFGPLRDTLRGNKFQGNEDVKTFVGNLLRRYDKDFFAAGKKSLKTVGTSREGPT